MNKTAVTFFFSMIFFISIITPTVITVLDNTCEISLIQDLGDLGGEEEEEKNNKESSKDLESKIFYAIDNSSLVFITRKTRALNYYYKKYTSVSQKLFLPPPEHSIA